MNTILTVTTAASDRSLLTIGELRDALGITDVGQDEKLLRLNARVAATIVRACKIAGYAATPPTLRQETLSEQFRLEEYFDGQLVLARRPVASITSITENDEALAADEYELDAAAGMLKRLSADDQICWPSGKITVVYVAGWDTVPDDLKLAAEKLARMLWAESGENDPSLKVVDIPGVIRTERWVAPTDDPLVPAEVMDLLTPYINDFFG